MPAATARIARKRFVIFAQPPSAPSERARARAASIPPASGRCQPGPALEAENDREAGAITSAFRFYTSHAQPKPRAVMMRRLANHLFRRDAIPGR